MSVSLPPPGWYNDPSQPGQSRWWDGTAWAEPLDPLPRWGRGPAHPAETLLTRFSILSRTAKLVLMAILQLLIGAAAAAWALRGHSVLWVVVAVICAAGAVRLVMMARRWWTVGAEVVELYTDGRSRTPMDPAALELANDVAFDADDASYMGLSATAMAVSVAATWADGAVWTIWSDWSAWLVFAFAQSVLVGTASERPIRGIRNILWRSPRVDHPAGYHRYRPWRVARSAPGTTPVPAPGRLRWLPPRLVAAILWLFTMTVILRFLLEAAPEVATPSGSFFGGLVTALTLTARIAALVIVWFWSLVMVLTPLFALFGRRN